MSIIDNIRINQDFDPEGENGGYKFDKDVKEELPEEAIYTYSGRVVWPLGPVDEPEPKPEPVFDPATYGHRVIGGDDLGGGVRTKTFAEVLEDAVKSKMPNPCGEIVLLDVDGNTVERFPRAQDFSEDEKAALFKEEQRILATDYSAIEQRIVDYCQSDVNAEMALHVVYADLERDGGWVEVDRADRSAELDLPMVLEMPTTFKKYGTVTGRSIG